MMPCRGRVRRFPIARSMPVELSALVVDSDLLTDRLPLGLLLDVPLVGLPYALSVQARREYQEQERST